MVASTRVRLPPRGPFSPDLRSGCRRGDGQPVMLSRSCNARLPHAIGRTPRVGTDKYSTTGPLNSRAGAQDSAAASLASLRSSDTGDHIDPPVIPAADALAEASRDLPR